MRRGEKEGEGKKSSLTFLVHIMLTELITVSPGSLRGAGERLEELIQEGERGKDGLGTEHRRQECGRVESEKCGGGS